MTSMDKTQLPQDPTGPRYFLVSFKAGGKLSLCRTKGISPEVGTQVIVQKDRTPALGIVVVGTRQAEGKEEWGAMDFLRIATPEDLTQEDRNRERERLALRSCLKHIQRLGLHMKLINVQYMMDAQKAIFFFTADGRVDFRALVKDLSRELRIRVEMRQIGVRDETKMIGGVGHCGLSLCCSTWLRDFVPVSIRMAKDQNMALNPQKVSGACGRLLCCLAYEHETYVKARKDLPKIGRRINTTAGPGRVLSLDVLKERFVFETEEGDRILLQASDVLPGDGPVFSRRKKSPVKPKTEAPEAVQGTSAEAKDPEAKDPEAKDPEAKDPEATEPDIKD